MNLLASDEASGFFFKKSLADTPSSSSSSLSDEEPDRQNKSNHNNEHVNVLSSTFWLDLNEEKQQLYQNPRGLFPPLHLQTPVGSKQEKTIKKTQQHVSLLNFGYQADFL